MAKTKFYLDTRRMGETNDANPLRINITKDGRTAAMPLGIYLASTEWDPKNGRVINHPDAKRLNKIISQKKLTADSIILKLQDEGKLGDMTAVQIRDHIVAAKAAKPKMKPEAKKPKATPKPKENPNTVEKFFNRYCEVKNLSKRTVGLYHTTWLRIQAWLGATNASALKFKDINLAWIEDFDKFLAVTAPNLNGRRVHHANLKAVINYAMNHEVTEKNSYRHFTIKTQPTAKRNLSVEQLRHIIFAKDLKPWMERHRDLFVLSFMLRGLNTVDLCHLTKPVDGRVEWRRTKTKKPISLKIEPEMQAIIDKHPGKDLMLDIAEGRNYRNYNNNLSNGLKDIRKTINARLREAGKQEIPNFSMRWARHTWATIAQSLGFAVDTVSEGLGHSQKSVAEIYINRDPTEVDRMNRAVLDYVLYGIDNRNPKTASSAQINNDILQDSLIDILKKIISRYSGDC